MTENSIQAGLTAKEIKYCFKSHGNIELVMIIRFS